MAATFTKDTHFLLFSICSHATVFANEDGPTGENFMRTATSPLSPRSLWSRLDLENDLVLVIGWVVALVVTWT